jgi:Domain of unknown function (DUF4349)
MKRLALLAVLLLGLSMIAACAGAAAPSQVRDLGAPFPSIAATSAPAPTAAPAASGAPGLAPFGSLSDTGTLKAAEQAAAERMVVYTGTMSLEVNDTEEVVAKMTDILKANQGYISSRSFTRSGSGKLRGSVTIRVPAASLESVLSQIKALAMRSLSEDSKSEDVTQQYIDLDARRKNLEAYEVELTKLLDTVREKTGKAEDLLAVYNQLTEVRGQIEQIKGQQQYLENTSSLATFTLELVPHEEVTVIEEGWNPGSTARTALHALVQSLQALADIAIYVLLFFLPVLVLLVLPLLVIFLIVRRIWRRRAPRKPATA